MANELPTVLEGISLHTHGKIYYQHNGAPIRSCRSCKTGKGGHFQHLWQTRSNIVILSPIIYSMFSYPGVIHSQFKVPSLCNGYEPYACWYDILNSVRREALNSEITT